MEKKLLLQGLSNLGTMVKLNFYTEFEKIAHLLKGNPEWKKHFELDNLFILAVSDDMIGQLSSIDTILEKFKDSLISAKFLCFNRGSFKPFCGSNDTNDITLLIFFKNLPSQFCAVAGTEVYEFQPGACYLFNPCEPCTMFSFIDKVICLELHIDLTKESYNNILHNLDIY